MTTDQAMSRPSGGARGSFANALRENLASAIVFVAAKDEGLAFSPEAGRLLGLAAPSPGHTALQLPAPLLAFARQGLAGCAVTARQIQFSVDGRELSVDLSVVPLLADGDLQGALLVLNDGASALQFEAHLHQVNRLANAGTLAASMAHEIKNALVAGKTFVDLLLERNQDPELVDVVRRELGRIDSIVSRMLKLVGSGTAVPAFTAFRMREVLDYAVRLLQPELENKGIALERFYEAGSDWVRGDPCELQQAVLNLLLNAFDALAQGGKITLRTELADDDVPQVRVSIADNGGGIVPEHLPHVFEPFFTTKASGTGLGLAITRRIIDDHGGSITVESQPGRGACFKLLLPTSKELAPG